jgi:hypothetical protein
MEHANINGVGVEMPAYVYNVTASASAKCAGVGGSFKIQNDKEHFDWLVEQWRNETGMYSSIKKKIAHPTYQRIIAFGERAVPWILHELRDRPTYWFTALQEITKDGPAGTGRFSDFQCARDAWLAWGRQRGLIE